MTVPSLFVFGLLLALGVGLVLIVAGALGRKPAPGRTCASCRFENAVDARFCARCGAPLAPDAP